MAYGQPLPPLPEPEVRAWWNRVELARSRRERESRVWEKLLRNYLPAGDNPESLNSNIHFRNVHLKSAELWAQMPELHLKPLEPLMGLTQPDPQTGQPVPVPPEDIVAIKRAVLNKLLGPDHADVDQTVTEVLFDIFAAPGIGPTKICYESDQPEIMADVPTGQMIPQPGSVLGLSPSIPETQQQTVPGPPVFERWRWYHFSAMKFLRPHDWRSTQYDEAPWLAMEFVEPLNGRTRKKYRLPEEFESNVTRDELVLGAEKLDGQAGATKLVRGVEIWLRAAVYDDSIVNSQQFRRLVLIEGMKDTAPIYEESPYQTIGPDGKLTIDSMIGNPIHPFVLRVLTDSDAPPADAAFTDPLVRLENTWVRQTVKLRDANNPRFVHPDSATEAIDKLKDADTGQGVGLPDDLFNQFGDKIIIPIPHLERAESDVVGQQNVRRLIDETLGLGANQAGGINSTVRSATEVATVQANVSVRLKGEQNALMKRWLQGVRKFDALVQRYMTDPGYIEIVGQDGEKRLAPFTQAHLSGRYAYDAKPDTQLTMDPDRRVKQCTDYVNFMAKSPYVDQHEMALLVTNEFGYDAGRLVKVPEPPSPPPEQPSISFKGEDLANSPISLGAAIGSGLKLTPELVAQAQQLISGAMAAVAANPSQSQLELIAAEAAKNQPHGGASDKSEKLSEHQNDLSGKMDGRAPENVGQTGVAH